MKEAREGRVEWFDLDVDTFVRFARFAYSNNYTPAKPELIVPAVPEDGVAIVSALDEQVGKALNGGNVEEEEEEDSSDQDDDSSASSEGSDPDEPIEVSSDDQETSEYSSSSEASSTLDNGGDGHLSRRPIDVSIDEYGLMHSYTTLPYSLENYMVEWEKCLHYRYTNSHDIHPHKRRRFDTDVVTRVPPRPINKKYEAMCIFIQPMYHPTPRAALRTGANVNPHESYRPVFLSHARLYILADKYGVNRLRRLALARLHRTLTHYVVHRDRVSDLVALAQEIFDNTMETDEARSLIVNYFVCFIEDIQNSPELEDALRRGGDFPAILISTMATHRI